MCVCSYKGKGLMNTRRAFNTNWEFKMIYKEGIFKFTICFEVK